MKLVYGVNQRPKFTSNLIYALQQVLAIISATIAVPALVNQQAGLMGADRMTASAAMFGAGVGTLIYILFTRGKSPVFLGSSFAFSQSMVVAFSGAYAFVSLGYLGLLIGAAFAGLVYVILAIAVKKAGIKWINQLMPPIVIGPTVAVIGLSLSGSAVGQLTATNSTGSVYLSLVCGLVALFITMLVSTYGKKSLRAMPFICGIAVAYLLALILTVIGTLASIDALKVIDFAPFRALVADGVSIKTFLSLPDFTFLKAFDGFSKLTPAYAGTVAVAYVPVAFVVFAEHIADHKNLSSIIEKDLLTDPGLPRTLLGDGVGSIAGAFFGGCPNTTYGESVGCVAISKNASIYTILTAAILCVFLSFLSPCVAVLESIPSCIMGGVCIALYGFIAVSGMKMFQNFDLGDNRNLFVVSVILVTGIGGMVVSFGKVSITSVACALILGIFTNLLLNKKKPSDK